MAKDAVDIAAVAYVLAREVGADTDNVISRGDAVAGSSTQGDVADPGGVVIKRKITIGRVETDDGVIERLNTAVLEGQKSYREKSAFG